MKPTGGFSNNQVARFFNETASTESGKSTTSSSSSSSKISGGAIAGAVVGSVIVAALIAALIIYLIRRQRKQQKNTNTPSSPATTETAEAPPDYKPARLDGAFFRNRGQAAELTSQQMSVLTELEISNPVTLHEMDGRPWEPAELPGTRPADVLKTKSRKR
jgi:hypothetical protein